ncbi:MAG TPA: glutathione S-transferase N-terminal domain-containing protein [Candidatus Cybelea sp.]|nr:glutathione S-transferase N-terminal domain-containing protein [Candidatus Cybelea sp.]
MIELYSWTTPNGHKIHIMLEETGLPYRVHKIDLGARQQDDPAFLKINPNGKIPAIVDTEGPDGKPLAIFESAAILIHLAQKSGMLLPTEPYARYAALEWLMFQIANIGPMFGQAFHFRSVAPERVPYAVDRYTNEVGRLLGVLDRRLWDATYLAGEEYTIADIATWPWVRNAASYGQNMENYPNVQRWITAIGERPAVRRGLKALSKAAAA